MRIAVIGAGAVGGYVGGRLAQAGYDVVLVETRTADTRDDALWTSPLVSFQIRCRLRYGGRDAPADGSRRPPGTGA